MFDLDFLHSYYSKFFFQLKKLLTTASKYFFHSEYEFKVGDWILGETCAISLSEFIRYDEKTETKFGKLTQLKEKKLPVPTDFNGTIDLTI